MVLIQKNEVLQWLCYHPTWSFLFWRKFFRHYNIFLHNSEHAWLPTYSV